MFRDGNKGILIIMKNGWFIILLLSTIRVYAQSTVESHVPFIGLPKEIRGVGQMFSDRGEPNEDLFTIRTGFSSEQLIIELKDENTEHSGKYEIYNIFGRRLLHGQISEKTTTLSTTGLAKGIYVIKVISDKKQYARKFIIR